MSQIARSGKGLLGSDSVPPTHHIFLGLLLLHALLPTIMVSVWADEVLRCYLLTHSEDCVLFSVHMMRFLKLHGVQRRMISVDNFFVFLRLLFFALLLLYET